MWLEYDKKHFKTPQVLLDVHRDDTVTAARNSPLMDSKLIAHFVDLLEAESMPSVTMQGGDRKMTQNMLKTYILRGFTNMIKYLGSEYLQLLKSNG